jgi:hypothetical protein
MTLEPNLTAGFTYHQLSKLDEWEFYRIVPSMKGSASFTIGLRPYTEFGQVEFELWDDRAEEPRFTQSMPCKDVGESWRTTVREPILVEIVARVRELLTREAREPGGETSL